MMQTAEPGERDNLAELGRLDAGMIWRGLAQGQVHSVLVVPVAEPAEQRPCVLFSQDDDMIEALAATTPKPVISTTRRYVLRPA